MELSAYKDSITELVQTIKYMGYIQIEQFAGSDVMESGRRVYMGETKFQKV